MNESAHLAEGSLPSALQELVDNSRHIWAKSSPPMALIQHLCEVCAQAAEFYVTSPPPASVVAELPQDETGNRICLPRVLAYSALLHDFGKIHPGFQQQLKPGGNRFGLRHEILSLAFLDCLEVDDTERTWIAAAIATHHKPWTQIHAEYQVGNSGPGTAIGRLANCSQAGFDALHALLQCSGVVFRWAGWPEFPVLAVKPMLVLSLVSSIEYQLKAIGQLFVAHGSSPFQKRPTQAESRSFRAVGTQLRGSLLAADHLASFGFRRLQTCLANVAEVEESFPGFRWRSHQSHLANSIGSTLLESPTGSGKTEGALLWAAAQVAVGHSGRVCFLLPYQASLNAMHRRLRLRLDPEGSATEPNRFVAMSHGRVHRVLYEQFLLTEHGPANSDAMARQQAEAARHAAAPFFLGTIFAVIRLLFATRGPERLHVGFNRARIVVDEIHAYDPQVSALAITALGFLQQHLNATLLCMSASMPTHLRGILDRELKVQHVLGAWDAPPRHKVRLVDDHLLSAASLRAIRLAAEEGSVLVVANQVVRAIAAAQLLQTSGAKVTLLHSRFTSQDRTAIERKITPLRGHILVGTQAVEVSLDIDYERCFSELAPVESLMQRLGRCNRRADRPPAEVTIYTQFEEGPSAYRPYAEAHLDQVATVLREHFGAEYRPANDAAWRAMLDPSYPAELVAELENSLSKKITELRRELVDRFRPFGLTDNGALAALEETWNDLFDGEEVLPEQLYESAAQAPNALHRSRYLVPISGRQMSRFRKSGRIQLDQALGCNVIRAPYSKELGLDLS